MRRNAVLKLVVGAAIGGLVGYIVVYKLIGCASGACPITRSPYISTIFGVVIGALLASGR
jgi:hypothetical protein